MNIKKVLHAFSENDIIIFKKTKYRVTSEFKTVIDNGIEKQMRYIYPYLPYTKQNISNEGIYVETNVFVEFVKMPKRYPVISEAEYIKRNAVLPGETTFSINIFQSLMPIRFIDFIETGWKDIEQIDNPAQWEDEVFRDSNNESYDMIVSISVTKKYKR